MSLSFLFSRSLLLLCGAISTVYCASSFSQSDFKGVANVAVGMDDSAAWTGKAKWCGGRNAVRHFKLGKVQPYLGQYYPFFSAMAMLCFTGDHGFGHAIDEKELDRLRTFIAWHDSSLACLHDSLTSIDAIRSLELIGTKLNGFGKATVHCVGGPGATLKTVHPDKGKLDGQPTYYLTCPGLQVLIGARVALNENGLQRIQGWCGSQMYYNSMVSYDGGYWPLVSIGDYPPGTKFVDYESGDPSKVTSAPVVCEEDTFVSGLDFIRSMNNEFYNILLHCSDGSKETSMVSGPALVPADKKAQYTTYSCTENKLPTPITDLYIMSDDNSGFSYGMPGMDVGCVDLSYIASYHNSSYEPGFDDVRNFKHLRCPLNTVMAGYVPIYTVREDKQGIYTLQLLCRSLACSFN